MTKLTESRNPRLRQPWKPDDSPPEQPAHTMGPECVYGTTLDYVPMTCPGCRWIVDRDKDQEKGITDASTSARHSDTTGIQRRRHARAIRPCASPWLDLHDDRQRSRQDAGPRWSRGADAINHGHGWPSLCEQPSRLATVGKEST